MQYKLLFVGMLLTFLCSCFTKYQKSNFKAQIDYQTDRTVLSELLQCDGRQLAKVIRPVVYSPDNNSPESLNVDDIKRSIRNDSLDYLPYWKVRKSKNVVLIMAGRGLWDIIWGYVLVDATSAEIKNIVFCHKSETPGLGAEISSRTFEEKFIGLKMIDMDRIKVGRPNNQKSDTSPYRVSGISGATITCDGVTEMLKTTAQNYERIFTAN